MKIMCSRKCANPCTGLGSLKEPTPMQRAAAASFSPPSPSASLPSCSSSSSPSLSVSSLVAEVTLTPSSLLSSIVLLLAGGGGVDLERSVGSDMSSAWNPFGRTIDLRKRIL